MTDKRRLLPLTIAFGLLATCPLAAELYTVTLRNGNTFESRYPPQVASWDKTKVVLLSEFGNWVGIDRVEIVDVTAETQQRGFGTVIDTTTISLGIAANDRPEEGEGGGPTVGGDVEPQRPYSVEQFVEPSQTQGIPGSFIGGATGRVTTPAAPSLPSTVPVAPAAPPPASSGDGGSGS